MSLEEGDVVLANPVATNHYQVPPGGILTPSRPSNREIGWRYWNDLINLPSVAPGEHEVAQPVVWTWTRNYGAVTRPAYSAAITASSERRQDMIRLRLKESQPIYGREENCITDYVGVLPEHEERIPRIGQCQRCGKGGVFRKLPNSLDGTPRYVAPHAGVQSFYDVATAEAAALFADSELGFVVATDHGYESGTAVDRGAVYKLASHELVGALYVNGAGKLAFRELSVPDYNLLDPLPPAVAMSAKRAEVRFFDAPSYQNLDLLAMRGINLDSGMAYRSTLHMVETTLAGPVVSAAYRDVDDSYFILSRGGSKVSLHRVDQAHMVEHVATWDDNGGASSADLTADEDGLLVVTSRSSTGFAAVVLSVHPITLAVLTSTVPVR